MQCDIFSIHLRFTRNLNSTHVQRVGNAHDTRIRRTNTRAVVYLFSLEASVKRPSPSDRTHVPQYTSPLYLGNPRRALLQQLRPR